MTFIKLHQLILILMMGKQGFCNKMFELINRNQNGEIIYFSDLKSNEQISLMNSFQNARVVKFENSSRMEKLDILKKAACEEEILYNLEQKMPLTAVIWILDINLLSQIVDAINSTAKMCSDKAIFGLFPAENSFLFINPKIDPFDYHFFIRQRDGHSWVMVGSLRKLTIIKICPHCTEARTHFLKVSFMLATFPLAPILTVILPVTVVRATSFLPSLLLLGCFCRCRLCKNLNCVHL